MKKRSILFSAGLLMAGFAVFEQAAAQQTCGTDHMYQQQLKKDPSIENKHKQLADFTRQYIQSHPHQRAANTPYIIPTVVHIIHYWGPENISDAQVYDAINIANTDLQRMNADTANVNPPFKPIIGNVNVQLRLAQVDPDGNCTNGITRTASLLTYNADDNVKAIISWDNSKYLNIWVVAQISFGAGGYSYYPGTAPPGCEGVVVLHTQFGGVGTSCGTNFCRRTLTHELGHYFNLPHTWGGTNSCGDANNCSIDDGIADTPNTIGNCLTCNLNAASCGPLENVENYMDYALCTKMFTVGQAQVCDAALNSTVGGRFFLWQNSNLVATGTDGTVLPPCIPIPYFMENARMVCVGDSIRFTDMSWNATVTSWNWNFPGGTPSSSTQQNPTVVYNTPGTYNVSLTAGTTTGGATYTKTNYVTVSPNNATYSNWQYYEGFEQSAIPNPDWIVNDTNGLGWYRTNAASYSGSYSVTINNYGNNYMDMDQLISPSMNLSVIVNPHLYFKVSYAQIDTSRDLLKIYISTNCGKTWYPRYARYGNTLATVPPQNTPFTPGSYLQWRLDSINLSPYASETDVRFKFEFYNKGGNNIYLDDINLSGPLGTDELLNLGNSFSVFPNPSSGNSTIGFKLSSADKVVICLQNVLGEKVSTVVEKEFSAGEQQVNLNTSGFAKGVYFISLSTSEGTVTRKLVVQ
ncbi:MAG TPA: M43 family zinc metalloprotease [Bacteroidia bacterium]|jgi:PKD repeat protein